MKKMLGLGVCCATLGLAGCFGLEALQSGRSDMGVAAPDAAVSDAAVPNGDMANMQPDMTSPPTPVYINRVTTGNKIDFYRAVSMAGATQIDDFWCFPNTWREPTGSTLSDAQAVDFANFPTGSGTLRNLDYVGCTMQRVVPGQRVVYALLKTAAPNGDQPVSELSSNPIDPSETDKRITPMVKIGYPLGVLAGTKVVYVATATSITCAAVVVDTTPGDRSAWKIDYTLTLAQPTEQGSGAPHERTAARCPCRNPLAIGACNLAFEPHYALGIVSLRCRGSFFIFYSASDIPS